MKSSVFGVIPRTEFTPVFSPSDCAKAGVAEAVATAIAKKIFFTDCPPS
jgi:hypothetical protein